jgi:hypothetical protein
MEVAMSDYEKLKAEFEEFDQLPLDKAGRKERKERVRNLDHRVREGSVALTEGNFREFRDGERTLGRICSYLLIEYDKAKAALPDWSANVRSEWERLQRVRFAPGTSTMPVYYALRSYHTRLKGSPESVAAAWPDRELLTQIDTALFQHWVDPGGQVRGLIAEILFVIEGRKSPPNPSVLAALITRKGAVIAAIITALAAIGVGILANWDKIRR